MKEGYVSAVETIYNYVYGRNYIESDDQTSEINAVVLDDDISFQNDYLWSVAKFWVDNGWEIVDSSAKERYYILQSPNLQTYIKVRFVSLNAVSAY